MTESAILPPVSTPRSTLAGIRCVLVGTTHTGNLGAAARAMKTMGLTHLELVKPRLPPDAEALARASGADDLLERAGVHEDLSGALAGCRLVIGASARLRSLPWPLLEPPAAARLLLAEATAGDVALVFGRESSGLANEELACCHYLVHIPTDPEFSSLNLAAAVQVLAYEIRRTWREGLGERLPEEPRDLATAEAMEGFHAHLTPDPGGYRLQRSRPVHQAADAVAASLQPGAPRLGGAQHPARGPACGPGAQGHGSSLPPESAADGPTT